MLWKEVYSITSVGTSTEGISILLGALARIAVCTQPSLQTHVLKPPPGGPTAAYDAYLARVRQSVVGLQSAFRAMRRPEFAEQLADYGELAREDEVQQLCTADAYSLLLLNLCPDPDVYRPAQNLLRQAFSTVESRADCFRILFQINHTASLYAPWLITCSNSSASPVASSRPTSWPSGWCEALPTLSMCSPAAPTVSCVPERRGPWSKIARLFSCGAQGFRPSGVSCAKA